MKSYNIKVSYFSPSGGTKKAAIMLANKLADKYEIIDSTSNCNREIEIALKGDDLLIIAAPVYAGKIPQVKGLFKNFKGDKTPCIVMAAYGNRHYDNALAEMQEILETSGFICIGAIAPIIPHIYSEKLGNNRPDSYDEVIIDNFACKIKEKLNNYNIESIIVPGERKPEFLETYPGSKIPRLFDKNKCVNCIACVSQCPVSAIDKDSKEINLNICISCMNCASVCKFEARTFDYSQTKIYLESNYLKRREVEYFI